VLLLQIDKALPIQAWRQSSQQESPLRWIVLQLVELIRGQQPDAQRAAQNIRVLLASDFFLQQLTRLGEVRVEVRLNRPEGDDFPLEPISGAEWGYFERFDVALHVVVRWRGKHRYHFLPDGRYS